jgi:methylphosphotriester-DNA--protein-cysteine methyltransferase
MWLGDACSFIESATNHLSERDVAAAVNVTPQRLVQGFRRFLGFTPDELLEDVLFNRTVT